MDCCVGESNKEDVLLKLGEGYEVTSSFLRSWIVPYGGSGSPLEVANELKLRGGSHPCSNIGTCCSISGIHLSLCDGELQLLF
jgi:hypothetical protein